MRLKLIPSTSAECYPTLQDQLVAWFGGAYAELPDTIKGVIRSDAEPDADFRDDWLWQRVVLGVPGKIYSFSDQYGLWVSEHPLPRGFITLYDGAITDLPTWDGGEAGNITPTTGPFWQEMVEIQGRFPIHPGSLPSGKIIQVGDTGGEETVQLLTKHMPKHRHGKPDDSQGFLGIGGGGASHNTGSGSDTSDHQQTAEAGEDVPHNNMPPYYGIYIVKRTARTHYRAP